MQEPEKGDPEAQGTPPATATVTEKDAYNRLVKAHRNPQFCSVSDGSQICFFENRAVLPSQTYTIMQMYTQVWAL